MTHRLLLRTAAASAGLTLAVLAAPAHAATDISIGHTEVADDDAVGPHPQGVADQVADGHRALALDVGGTRLQADHVVLLELELRGVLDRDDPLVGGDEGGEHVQGGRLAGTGAAGDHHVEATPHAGVEEVRGAVAQGAEPDQVVDGQRVRCELADRERAAVDGEWWNDRVHAASVGQPGVDHG